MMPNTIKVDLKASQNSDMISEITVFADQSSRLINELETGLDTSKTMLEQRNPLETEEDNLLGEVELGFEDENEDLLLDDFENDMNSFDLNHKETQDRLKSVVKIS